MQEQQQMQPEPQQLELSCQPLWLQLEQLEHLPTQVQLELILLENLYQKC